MLSKICLTCGKRFYKDGSNSKKYWKTRQYCSIVCSGTLIKKGEIRSPSTLVKKGSSGEKSLSYKGGRSITKAGYIRVLIVGTGSYELEHRKIMEQHLGRELGRFEHVHHINHIKTDNRIENLQLMDIHEHNKQHTTERWKAGGSNGRLGH